ncbi:hypothetical protein ABFV99_14795 [Cytobacillus horneckiae]|uniref:hypothetical protein n=1 Tax=Cytobacillus horneckiae TaxID=549687 RepID=UPI0034CE6C91
MQAFLNVDEQGNITNSYCGINIVAVESYDYFFIIEDYLVGQLDKLKVTIINGKPELVVKDGEVIDVPELTEEERRIKELEEELNRLRSQL